MRILYFHQHFSTPSGAAGTRSFEMAKALVAKGHEVTVVCGSYGVGKTGLNSEFRKGRREGVVEGIHVIEFDLAYSNHDGFIKRTVQFLRYVIKGLKVVLTHKYDLLFASSTPLTAGIPGIFNAVTIRKPFVFEVRDLWPELPRSMGVIRNPLVLFLMGVLESLSYKAAKGCIGLSPGIVAGIAKKSAKGKKIAMIPNGCDFSVFDTGDRKGWRPDEVGSAPFAIFAGTHGTANGLGAVLDAAAVLKASGKNHLKIVLVGEGREKRDLVERAKRESLDNVVFLGAVSKIQLARLFNAAGVGLMILKNVPAFYYGTSPNKFFDYLAAGIPVVCNYPGWMADQINSSGCGIAVPPENPKLLADAIAEVLESPERAAQMSQRATELGKSHYAREDLAKQFVSFLESMA